MHGDEKIQHHFKKSMDILDFVRPVDTFLVSVYADHDPYHLYEPASFPAGTSDSSTDALCSPWQSPQVRKCMMVIWLIVKDRYEKKGSL